MKISWRSLAVLMLSACLLAAAATAENTETEPTEDQAVVPSEEGDVVETEPRPPHEPTLTTVSEGQIRGIKEEAHNGKEFYSFRGLPFAAPPVGELRFQPAEVPKSWEGVRSADTEPPLCPQMTTENVLQNGNYTMTGQEDCLYLNVYSPMYEQVSVHDPLLPVMVFIHGGGYFFGGAEQYQPYTLMTQDIVLVVIQYRLGTLGFLSTEDDVAPGNMGILDQTFALDWIQRNVPSFGGDPLMITIFGESAGAASVHLQMLSHTSLGYFHRAIMQSGNTLAPWSMATNHRTVTYFIAKVLGCGKLADADTAANCTMDKENPATYESCLVDLLPSEKIMDCLKEAPLEVLAESTTWFSQFGALPIMMGPRVDKNLVMQDPVMLLKEGRYKKINIMMGVTKDEGTLQSMPLYSNEGLRSAMRFKFDELAPVALDFGSEDIAPLNQTIKIFDHYVGSLDIDRETADNVTAMFGDRLIWYPTDSAAFLHAEDWHSKKKNRSTYVYELVYRGEQSVNDMYNLDIGQHWVAHADDLMYLFGALSDVYSFKDPMKSEEDQKISDMMVKMWTNFAATGNPTPDEEPLSWKPFSAEQPVVLVIDTEPKMSAPEHKAEIRKFWRQLPLKANMILFPESVANLVKTELTPESEVQAADNDQEASTITPPSGDTDTEKPVEDSDSKTQEETNTKDEL